MLSQFNPFSKVMPIVDLLAISNTHFQKLKHFIHMQLPSGFPVKIEIPLFHVINAQITFSNIQVFIQARLITLWQKLQKLFCFTLFKSLSWRLWTTPLEVLQASRKNLGILQQPLMIQFLRWEYVKQVSALRGSQCWNVFSCRYPAAMTC